MTQDFEYEGKNSVSDARAENQPEQVSHCPVCRECVGNVKLNNNNGLADPFPTFPTVSYAGSDGRAKVSEMSEIPLGFPTSDALSDAPPARPLFRAWTITDLAALPHPTDPEVCGVTIEDQVLTLDWGGYGYDIGMDRINAPEDLLWIIHHVGKKIWKRMTAKKISALIEIVAREKGWPSYGSVGHKNEMPKAFKGGAKVEREKMTPALRYRVLKRDAHRCRCCGATVSTGAVLHVDHIVPVSKGGLTEASNLQTLCASCNLGKRDTL